MSVKIIECSNKSSNSFDASNASRSTSNSQWENDVDIELNSGDQVMIDSSILNLQGISADETVSILADDGAYHMADSKMFFRFTSYVNDNAVNTIHMPFCGANREIIYPLAYEQPTGTDPDRYPEFDVLYTLKKDGETTIQSNYVEFDWVCGGIYGNQNADTAPFNAGEINTRNSDYDNLFRFSYNSPSNARTSQMTTPFNYNMRTIWSEKASNGSWHSITGKKYTLLDPDYMGCYRKNATEFWDDNEECNPQYFDLKVDLGGEMFETPSTIANTINDQLNTSDEYSKNSPYVVDTMFQFQKLPTLTGALMKVRKVNGEGGADEPTGRKSMYGNLAVLNLKHWQGVHRLMRCDLAFSNKVNYNSINQFKTIYQPVFIMPNGNMNDSVYYPSTTKQMTYKYKPIKSNGTHNDDVVKTFDYSTLPKYFLMCSNIAYTDINLQRIQTFMRNTEIYDGTSSDSNADDDVSNWRSHWNIGISHQSQFGEGNRFLYYCSQGNFNITEKDIEGEAYGYSYPYYPFDDVGIESKATSRSDIPDVGYVKMWSYSDGNEKPNDYYVISEIVDDSQIHRFKDNKMGDASIAFFSKYQSDWKDNLRTDGYDMTDVDYGDDSLSQKYNIMVVPVNMKASKLSNYYINIVDTFWIGACTSFYQPNFFNNPDTSFMYKITTGHDADHIYHGGLSLYQYNSLTQTWNVIDECYIYSFFNQILPNGRNDVNGLQYDGHYTVDLTTQHNVFVVDCGNTRRQVMVFEDVDDLSRCKVYYCAGYDYKIGGINTNDYTPLGGAPIPIDGVYREVHLTDMYIGSSYSPSRFFMPVNGGVNNELPVKQPIANNPIEQVCGFVLYSDSATQDDNGNWTINTDFALPILHQGQFCVSASFMEPRNEAVWLTNDQRYDTNATEPSNESSYSVEAADIINYLQVGANNPTFTFDNGLSRCGFQNLHIAKRMSILDMPYDNTTSEYVEDDTLGTLVIKVSDQIVKNTYLYNMLYAFEYNEGFITGSGTNFNSGLNYSIAGISFHSMYGESIEENFTDPSDMIQYTSDNWTGCLLNKLGFDYSDLFIKFGMPDNIYDSSIAMSSNVKFRYQKVSPITTNPIIDISSSIDLSEQDYTKKNSAGASEPLFSLSIGTLIPVNLDGSNSEIILASNLPTKSSTPFYKIYSSLSTDEYFSNTEQFQIAGICSKKYITGDYIYGEDGRPMTVSFPMKLSKIRTEIRDSQGGLIALDSDNYVMYKIISNT